MNIKRLYNQNRKKIWFVILVIALLFILLQLINSYVKESEEISDVSEDTDVVDNTQNSSTESKVTSNTSAVTGSDISEEKLDEVQILFDEFFGYCNSKDLQNAYDMLTDDCKELIYPSVELFEANYYNNVFDGETKIYNFENWSGDIYLVTLQDDVLATGQTEENANKKVDYITIDDAKLNISSFIGKQTMTKETTKNDITFLIESVETYMDYEVYNITVTNNTENTICLADVDSSSNIYLLDDNDVTYKFYNHELTQNSLVIKGGQTSQISLKFYSSYITTKKIENMVFKNVYMDYVKDKENIETIYIEV